MRISDWSSDVCSSDLPLRADAKGTIHGLTLGTKRAHIVRAALESLSHQLHDLAGAFAADGMPWRTLCIDGGMSANDWIAQDLADILDLHVDRPAEEIGRATWRERGGQTV